MKKKHIKKFKPLQELYNHGETTLLNSKVSGLFNVFLEQSTVDQDSVDVLTRERVKVKNHRQLHSGETSIIPSSSCKNSSTEALLSFDPLKAPSLEDQPMFQSASTKSTLKHQVQDVFDCQGDDSSCISKEDVEVMISGDHFGGADYNNATNSSASVSSSCQDILDKSLIGESITNGSTVGHMSVEKGGLNSMRARSSEAVLPAKGFCEGLNFNSPITSIQKPCLQNQKVMNVDGSEELVDVRVCDICGDAGREALLALCSKCNDGAEHIYCMSPKMDEVPESDWLCEECLLIQEPKRHHHAMVERSDNTSTPLCSKEGSPSLYTAVKHVEKMRKIHSSKSSGLSDKRPGSSINVSIKSKKRTIDKRVQLPKISGSKRQARLTQVSLMKNMEKRKDSAHQLSSSVDLPEKVLTQAGSSCPRSPKPKLQLCGESLNSLEVQCSQEDIDQRRSSSKENVACKWKKKNPGKKVFKSLPCNSVGAISPDANVHSSTPTKKGVKCGRGKRSTVKFSQENKTSPLRQTRVISKIVKKGNSCRKNVKDKNTIQVNENTNAKPLGSLANEEKNDMNALGAGSVEVTKSPCRSSYMVNSPAVIGDAYSGQRVSLSTLDAKIDDNDQSLAYKMPFEFQDLQVMPTLDPADIGHTVPSRISVVPESRCIWKGTFKLDKRGELSSDGYGVQAHLSTHASSKVDELVLDFSTELKLKEVPREHSWPIQFQKNHPTEQDIALYFFAQDLLSYQRSYRKLLEGMIGNDLALEADFGGFQLLIFPSILLPVVSQRWNSLPYLWGVFRVRELDDSHFSNLNVFPVNQHLGSPVTDRSEREFDFPAVFGIAFTSHTPNKSLESAESIDPMVLQSSASMKSRDQSSEREIPSPEEYTLTEHQLLASNTVFSDDRRTEGFDRSLQSEHLQKGKTIFHENLKSISNANIFRCSKSTTPVGFCSDVASGSSLSLDSGPSGLSDSGWFAKSTDEDPFENPGNNTNALNLDLCLANRSASEEEDVDLDLTLGFPSRSANQLKDCSKDVNDEDENISLVLSIGMPML